MSGVFAGRRGAPFTSLCDYCDAVIDAGDVVARIGEGRYVCLRCARTERQRHTGGSRDL